MWTCCTVYLLASEDLEQDEDHGGSELIAFVIVDLI